MIHTLVKPDVVTRTSHCSFCERLGYPRKKTAYIVFGSTHERYYQHLHMGEVSSRNTGLTPHLFFNRHAKYIIDRRKDRSKEKPTDLVLIPSICGVIGCGVDIVWNEKADRWKVKFLRMKDPQLLTRKDHEALINYTDSSFYLNIDSVQEWLVPDIIDEQKKIYRYEKQKDFVERAKENRR